jgi:hypothetical protein
MESKIKMVRKGGYTVLPNQILRDDSLTLQAKGLFCMMASFPEGWDFTVKGLATVAGCGREKISAALRNLEDSGYLLREQGHSETGQFAANLFVLYDEKIAPLTGFPSTGKPSTGKPLTENPTQINKERIKERKNKPPIAPREVLDRVREACGEDQELLDGIIALLENRAAIRKPVKTLRAINGILKDLSTYSGGSRRTALAMLEQAVKRNWLTVYPLKPDELPQAGKGEEKEEYGWQSG